MKLANGVKAILFDFDGTLRHSLPSGGEVFTNYVISQGLPVTNEDRRRAAIWEHYYFASSPEIQADQKNFNGEEDGFWFNFAYRRLVALGCSPDIVPELGPKVAAHMQEAYKPENWIPEEVHIVIPALRNAGYTLGVVSNRDKPYQEEIDGFGMGSYFHFSLAAGEVKSWKPEPGVFEHALKIAGTAPDQTLYIGDNYFADVVGARRAGLQPVLYDPRGLFHEPGCPVIATFEDLMKIVKDS
jgi:HAD superfamily hydrolase (TIGR01549 family)